MFKNLITTAIITATAFAPHVFAQNSVITNKANCAKLSDKTHPFILVLDSGDDLLKSIAQCAKDAKLNGASISGLGQLHNPTLAYFTSNPKDKPTTTTFPGYYELASINGNVTTNENGYYTHAHAVLADKQFHGIAGHVDSAKVGLTVEITMVPFTCAATREVDPNTGFGAIIH